jgi:hypothetical protein
MPAGVNRVRKDGLTGPTSPSSSTGAPARRPAQTMIMHIGLVDRSTSQVRTKWPDLAAGIESWAEEHAFDAVPLILRLRHPVLS